MKQVYVIMQKGTGNILAWSNQCWLTKDAAQKCIDDIAQGDQEYLSKWWVRPLMVMDSVVIVGSAEPGVRDAVTQLWLEACTSYNQALESAKKEGTGRNDDTWYYEGQRNAYGNALDLLVPEEEKTLIAASATPALPSSSKDGGVPADSVVYTRSKFRLIMGFCIAISLFLGMFIAQLPFINFHVILVLLITCVIAFVFKTFFGLD